MPEYFRGLDRGLAILQDMREYEFSMTRKNKQVCQMFLEMVIADYTRIIEEEKEKALEGLK